MEAPEVELDCDLTDEVTGSAALTKRIMQTLSRFNFRYRDDAELHHAVAKVLLDDHFDHSRRTLSDRNRYILCQFGLAIFAAPYRWDFSHLLAQVANEEEVESILVLLGHPSPMRHAWAGKMVTGYVVGASR